MEEKTGNKRGGGGLEEEFTFMKKEESYCIYYGNMVA